MHTNKKGEYLTPKAEVLELYFDKDVLIAGSGNETLRQGSNTYDDADFI